MTTTAPSTPQPGSRVAGWLTYDEFMLLTTICDTLFPTLEPPDGSSEVVAAYFRRNARDLHLAEWLAETLAQENAQAQTDFRQLLALMASPVSGLLLVGSANPFTKLTPEQRERYLLAMANSPLGQLRQGYQAIKRLAGFLYFAVPDEQGHNANWSVLDYTVPPPPTPLQQAQSLQPLTFVADTTLEDDVVVIGSGAGGGVAAAELAAAGKSVIVLEKGGYNNETNFTLQEAQAMSELYLKRATLTSKDLGIIVLAGKTLGGGTTVNWMTSLRTPPNILEEWEQRSGLPGRFTGSALQDAFSQVEQRISVNKDNSNHNRQNQLLYDGCSALGYHAGVIPRNAIDCQQRCGTCGFGCRYGCKQSTMKTYVQDAYEHGARVIVNCSADRVVIGSNERVEGVQATVSDPATGEKHALTIHAKTVVVAAGAVHSPAILLRSGLEHAHIGRHLSLHPTSTIAGTYPEPVRSWEGVMQSAYCDQFGSLDGNYGYKLEVPPAHPGLLGLGTPWTSARTYREQMLQAANTAVIIVLTRDKGEGAITLDRDGEPVIDYVVSVYDRRHMRHGLEQAARIHLAAGATMVSSLHSRETRLERPAQGELTERYFQQFARQLERHGMGPNRLTVFSAHQMGTCRMGADPKTAVTDANGEVYGVKGLFVCDSSLFPAPSGVNPMLSIMGLAYSVCQYIKTVV